MATYAVDLTDAIIFTVYQNVVAGLVPSTVQVVRAQVNRVPPPVGMDYIAMTPTRRALLELPIVTWDITNPNPTTMNMESHMQLDIKLDVYGPNSADYASIIENIFESGVGYDLFRYCSVLPAGAVIEPLYCDAVRQLPFQNAAQQWQDRWIVETAIQADLNITITQDFANALVAGLIDVDAVYPP